MVRKGSKSPKHTAIIRFSRSCLSPLFLLLGWEPYGDRIFRSCLQNAPATAHSNYALSPLLPSPHTDPPILFFLFVDFLAFIFLFVRCSLLSWCVFPFFSKDFRFRKEKNPCFFGGFSYFSPGSGHLTFHRTSRPRESQTPPM